MESLHMKLDSIVPDQTLDTTGLSCPMPLLKTKKFLSQMSSGEIIEVISTDPGSHNDIPKFGNKGNNSYIGHVETDSGIIKHYIRKG